MSNMKKNVKEIKDFLRNHGGLIVTNRQIGKSEALIELLHEDKESYIIAFKNQNAMDLKRRYVKKYKDGKERHGIVTQQEANPHQVKNGYIDEYFFHDTYYKEFKGAVSTMRFPVKIKKFKNNPLISKAEMKLVFTKEQYAQEHSLKFK